MLGWGVTAFALHRRLYIPSDRWEERHWNEVNRSGFFPLLLFLFRGVVAIKSNPPLPPIPQALISQFLTRNPNRQNRYNLDRIEALGRPPWAIDERFCILKF